MDDIERCNKLANLESIKDDAESIYEEQVGTYIAQARFCQRIYEGNQDEGKKIELQGYKDEFYRKLREFIGSDFQAKRKITKENLEKFYNLENLDWSKKENIDNVNNHNLSLRHREM